MNPLFVPILIFVDYNIKFTSEIFISKGGIVFEIILPEIWSDYVNEGRIICNWKKQPEKRSNASHFMHKFEG